jgi:cell division protein FtsA
MSPPSLPPATCPISAHGREVLHAQPVNFSLDHRTGLADPRGHVGSRLSVDMHLLSIEAGAIETLLHCVKRCDLDLAGIASAPYVSGISSLVEDEQELGAACIDMGGGSTSLSIFMKRHMIFADTVRMGGDHVTSDISHGLQIPMPHAERIKARFGGVMATGLDDREIIELESETGDWHHDRRTVSRSELIGVMRPRIEEILEETRARLDAAGFDHLPSQRIVLTGGREPSARASTVWQAAFWAIRCALAAPCAFRACRNRPVGLRFRPASVSRFSRRIRRTNGGISRLPPTATRRAA